MRRDDVVRAWIDNKKVYDIVPQSWIVECLKKYNIPDKDIRFITEAKKNKKVELTARGKPLADLKIWRSIFQGDVLSQLLFVIAIKLHIYILKKGIGDCKFTKS